MSKVSKAAIGKDRNINFSWEGFNNYFEIYKNMLLGETGLYSNQNFFPGNQIVVWSSMLHQYSITSEDSRKSLSFIVKATFEHIRTGIKDQAARFEYLRPDLDPIVNSAIELIVEGIDNKLELAKLKEYLKLAFNNETSDNEKTFDSNKVENISIKIC